MNTEVGLIIAEASTKQNKIFIPIIIDKGLKIPSYLSHYYYIDYTNGRPFEENTSQVLSAIHNRSLRGHNPQIQKSISEGLKHQEKLLRAEILDYKLDKSKARSFRVFSWVTIIMTLITSIVLFLYFSINYQSTN